jgi:hypothetical protein
MPHWYLFKTNLPAGLGSRRNYRDLDEMAYSSTSVVLPAMPRGGIYDTTKGYIIGLTRSGWKLRIPASRFPMPATVELLLYFRLLVRVGPVMAALIVATGGSLLGWGIASLIALLGASWLESIIRKQR